MKTDETSLQLEHYFFPEIEVNANPDYFSEQKEEGFSVEADCTLLPDPVQKGRFSFQLRLRVVDRDVDVIAPYHVNLLTFGAFSVDEELSEPMAHYTLAALSILISSAREFLQLITARGPGPILQLPTLNPRHILDNADVIDLRTPSTETGGDPEGPGTRRRA